MLLDIAPLIRADICMVECRRSTRFTPKTFEGLGVFRKFVRQEFQGDKTAKLGVLGLVNYAHASATKPFDNVVVAEGLADEGIVPRSLGGHEEALSSFPLKRMLGLYFREVNDEL